ncbi:uncharacterized protein EDB91DRAFT_1094933 [Suillus paluster]|uniref:uncharacterized protein n=1 Tax=Suillus paluster TaxID=48578 RepID=UPI001B85B9B6|nr:uncharacterized protein EDB91DRAFT_1094933 [Suillus paluster]KAG1756877.1 hypothetical protein EDB91DRAFT_1094933 [Suillus paluster]
MSWWAYSTIPLVLLAVMSQGQNHYCSSCGLDISCCLRYLLLAAYSHLHTLICACLHLSAPILVHLRCYSSAFICIRLPLVRTSSCFFRCISARPHLWALCCVCLCLSRSA